MAITASLVKELREATGLGMMACKKALQEADGDMEKAIENLRKQGQATAAKRADKAATEGKIGILSDDSSSLIYEVNSETDFVAKNKDFQEFFENLGSVLLKNKPADIKEAKALKSDLFNNESVEAKITDLIGKIGEKITFSRYNLFTKSGSEKIFPYIHGNGKIGVMVKIETKADESESLTRVGKDLAMQVAAAKPAAVTEHGLDQEMIEKEKDIYREQAKNSGKPEKIWENIINGRMKKYFKQIVLMQQEFIKDPDLSIEEYLKGAEKEIGKEIKVKDFIRYELGQSSQ